MQMQKKFESSATDTILGLWPISLGGLATCDQHGIEEEFRHSGEYN